MFFGTFLESLITIDGSGSSLGHHTSYTNRLCPPSSSKPTSIFSSLSYCFKVITFLSFKNIIIVYYNMILNSFQHKRSLIKMKIIQLDNNCFFYKNTIYSITDKSIAMQVIDDYVL